MYTSRAVSDGRLPLYDADCGLLCRLIVEVDFYLLSVAITLLELNPRGTAATGSLGKSSNLCKWGVI